MNNYFKLANDAIEFGKGLAKSLEPENENKTISIISTSYHGISFLQNLANRQEVAKPIPTFQEAITFSCDCLSKHISKDNLFFKECSQGYSKMSEEEFWHHYDLLTTPLLKRHKNNLSVIKFLKFSKGEAHHISLKEFEEAYDIIIEYDIENIKEEYRNLGTEFIEKRISDYREFINILKAILKQNIEQQTSQHRL